MKKAVEEKQTKKTVEEKKTKQAVETFFDVIRRLVTQI